MIGVDLDSDMPMIPMRTLRESPYHVQNTDDSPPEIAECTVFSTPESTPTKHRRRTYQLRKHTLSTLDRNNAHPTPNIEDDTEFYDIGTPPGPTLPTPTEDTTYEHRRLRTPPRGRRPRKKPCPIGYKCEESEIVPSRTTTTTPCGR